MKKVFNPLVPPFDSVPNNLTDIDTRSHTSLTDIGTNTHAQIDTHIGSTSNPHTTTLEQARTANNSVSGQIISTLATGTKPFAPTSTTKCDNLNADLLDGLHDTNFTKTTAGQTINVSTADELTAALANLAAAPSLLGNVIIQLAAGTYSGNFTIPALLFNGFTLELKGTYSTVLGSTTATGGTSAIQPTVVKTGAGWTVNAYKNKIIKFTSGTNNNLFRLIDTNTTDTLTLCGEALTSAPQNGDTFEIYDWGTVIGASSGVAITANSVKGLKFTAIKFSGASAFNVITSDCIMTITECAFADINTIFGSPNTYVYHCLFLPKSGARTDHRMSNTSYYGCKWDLQENNSLGVLLRIGYTLVRNGCVVDGNNFALGWGIQIDNAGHCQFHIAGNIVRNCNVGIYVINGSGAMNQSVNVTYTNNVTNINVDTTSWSS